MVIDIYNHGCIPWVIMDKPHVAALKRAIEIAGSQSALAEGLAKFLERPTISQQTVSKWLKNETLIDAVYWPGFEHVTGGEITGGQLRPDAFRFTQPATHARN